VKANCWAGPTQVEVRDVPEPAILNRRDAIVKITSTAMRIGSSPLRRLRADHAGR
jgi:threonine dehydrogenase-like Zn-dependent dehydrogenase